MSPDWHTIATIIGTMLALGGVMFAMMRGFFKTTLGCQTTQEKCQQQVCKKIDELKGEVKENKAIVTKHYNELSTTLARIEGRMQNNTE